MFPSEWHEIAWLAAQSERQNGQRDTEDVAIIPDEEHWFPGSKLRSDYIKHKGLSQEKVDVLWWRKGKLIEDRQRVLLDSIRAEEESKVRVEEERLKAFGLFGIQQKKEAAVPATAKASIDAQEARRKEQDLQHDIHEQTVRSREKEEAELAWLEEGGVVTANFASELSKRKNVQERNEATKKRKVHFEGNRERSENKQFEIPAQKTINENSIQGTKKTTAVQQKKLPRAPKTIQTKHSKPFQQPTPVQPPSHVTARPGNPQHHKVLANSFATNNAQEALEILQAVTLSKKSYRENTQQAVLQRAAMSQKSVSEYLKDEGFANMDEYLDAMLASADLPQAPPPAPSDPARIPAPQGLVSYLEDLWKAHSSGSRARARLKNMSWEEYTKADTGLSPRAYIDRKIDAVDITVDDIPSCLTGGMTVVEEARARVKWDRLCGIIMDANDFEAQTQAASLPAETLRAVDGKSYAIL
jgi:hypothetical protein